MLIELLKKNLRSKSKRMRERWRTCWGDREGTISWSRLRGKIYHTSNFNIFPIQNHLERMGSPENAVPARICEAPQTASLSYLDFQPPFPSSPPLPIPMMTGIVFLSPLNHHGPQVRWSHPPRTRVPCKWELDVYDLIYAKDVLIIRNSPH